jgi:hypothetical protein
MQGLQIADATGAASLLNVQAYGVANTAPSINVNPQYGFVGIGCNAVTYAQLNVCGALQINVKTGSAFANDVVLAGNITSDLRYDGASGQLIHTGAGDPTASASLANKYYLISVADETLLPPVTVDLSGHAGGTTGNTLIQQVNPAVSGTNFNSPKLTLNGTYYNSSSLNDGWSAQTVLGTGSSPTSVLSLVHSGSAGYSGVNLPSLEIAGARLTRSLGWSFGDVATSPPLTTSEVGYITVPFACTLTGWHIMANTGTVTIKTARVATGGTALPTLGSNSISTSGVSLSTGTLINSTTLTDFTSTTINAGDTLGFFVTSVASAAQVTFSLDCAQ